MNLQDDVRGLMTLPDDLGGIRAGASPAAAGCRTSRDAHHPTAQQREQTRQKTLARKQAELAEKSPPDPSRVRERTLIARFPSLTSWSDCPVPLTGVYSRDVYADGRGQLVAGDDQ